MAKRISRATQHAGALDTGGVDEAMQKTLGIDNPYATPAGRAAAKQQPGESDSAYMRRQRKRVEQGVARGIIGKPRAFKKRSPTHIAGD